MTRVFLFTDGFTTFQLNCDETLLTSHSPYFFGPDTIQVDTVDSNILNLFVISVTNIDVFETMPMHELHQLSELYDLFRCTVLHSQLSLFICNLQSIP